MPISIHLYQLFLSILKFQSGKGEAKPFRGPQSAPWPHVGNIWHDCIMLDFLDFCCLQGVPQLSDAWLKQVQSAVSARSEAGSSGERLQMNSADRTGGLVGMSTRPRGPLLSQSTRHDFNQPQL